MRKPIATIVLVVCLLLALPAAHASANATDDRIVQDCQNSATGALSGSYTKSQLRHAKRNLPGDVAEYSGCYDAISQALLATAAENGGGGGDTGSGGGGGVGGVGGTGGGTGAGATGDGAAAGAAPSGPEHVGTEAPVELAGGTPVEPGALPSIGQDAHELPGPLVALLVLLAIAALASAATTIGRRVVARRRA